MKFSIDNNFLIKIILYFLGFIILIYNLYLSDFNLPNYQGNYGFLNYSLEATEKDFFSSIIWEQTMVPFFRIYIFVFWKYFKDFIDINYILWFLNLIFYFLFIKWNLKIFKIDFNKNKIGILFAILVITNPFYPLTILWPFHSTFFMILFMYFTYLIFSKNEINFKRFIKINFLLLLMSLTWPGMNHLIFLVIFVIFFIVSNFKKRIILFLTLITVMIYPFKNYYFFGNFGPTNLAGFTNGLNTVWPWVSEEKKDQLLQENKISVMFREALRSDFASSHQTILKKSEKLILKVNEYSDDKNLPWLIDENFDYIWRKDKQKIHFLNDLFSKDGFIAWQSPAMVPISNHFNDIGISLLDDYIMDDELRKSLYKSLEVKIGGTLVAPDLYYKWYPIYQKSWEDLGKYSYNFPTLNIFKVTAINERDIRTPSVFSLLSILISTYIFFSLVLNINISKKIKLNTLLILIIYSFYVKFSMVLNFSSQFEFIASSIFLLLILLIINKKISNREAIKKTYFENFKLNYKLLIGVVFIIYSFVFSSYISLFECNRYFGIFSPIILPLIYFFLELDKKYNENYFQFKIL